jgi:hypothetical protein
MKGVGLIFLAGVVLVAFETYLEANKTSCERRSFSAMVRLCDPGPKFRPDPDADY